ncbi:hypothetical protein LTR95_007809 [Oleoguttula sp. CCFEE 5521]
MTTPRTDTASFHAYLSSLQYPRIIALCGAGLSASSGLPTFRGPGGYWRTHEATSLATPGAFLRDAGLVWQFYSYRRHMALTVKPNPAHYALAELSRKIPGFQCFSQNVDGLHQRADHPREGLQLLHGTLFEVKCWSENCGYREENFTDPIVPALALPVDGKDPTATPDISDPKVPLSRIPIESLPQCPRCKRNALRPGVVWFGEKLPMQILMNVENYLNDLAGVDLILVIGTSAKVYPAAGYVQEARQRGAKVAVINMDANDVPAGGWEDGDWMFKGDAAVIVPELLKPVIGDVIVPQ